MHFYLPEMIFALFMLSGTQPRVAAITSDIIVWPAYVVLERARSFPCVVRLDDVVVFDAEHPGGHTTFRTALVYGPPSPPRSSKSVKAPPATGFNTWTCYTKADPSTFTWWTRGVTLPAPPWDTARCVLHHFCRSANFFVVRGYEAAIIPWP